MSRREKTVATASGRGPGIGLWLGGLCCGGLIVLAPGSALLLIGLLLPIGLVAVLPDHHGGPRVTQAALLLGLAASVDPIRMLWQDGAAPDQALAMLRQPVILFSPWLSILGAWVLAEGAGFVLKLQSDFVASRVRHQLMKELAAIEDEWGPMPASAPLPPL